MVEAVQKFTMKSNDVMTVEDLAVFMGVSPGWVYRHKSKIPNRKVGHLYFFHRPTIERWLAEGHDTEDVSDCISPKEEARRFVNSIGM